MKIHRLSIVFFIVTLVMYVAGNVSLPITDPVESAYALTAKEMVISGDWLSPQIFHQYWYDKPALIYWLIALSYKLFGISDFAARLPSGLLGALSVAWMYQLVRSISGRRLLAIWSAIVLGTSLEFWILAHGIVTDMALLLASVGTFGYAYRGLAEGRTKWIVIAYLFAGIGVLGKGPVGIVLPGLLFLVYAGVMRSWRMVRLLFPWQGILVFLLVAGPWYGYMYHTHGQAFVDGFLGLHNIGRALESEHPADNHWWYYLALFPAASLPWTGAVIYGMYYGWRQRSDFYLFSMIAGWGTILFYTLMATKYPTYTFISLVPFSFLGAVGIVKLLRIGADRRLWWILMGPTFFLWGLLAVGSYFVGWGFWYLLYVLVGVGIVLLLACYFNGKRYLLPAVIGLVTMLIAGVVIYEGVAPLVIRRSSVDYVPAVEAFRGQVYYYDGYSTSLVYYTDREVIRINSDYAPEEKRSALWNGKYKMPIVSEQEAYAHLSKEQALVIVPRRSLKYLQQSPLMGLFRVYAEEPGVIIFMTGSGLVTMGDN